MGRGLSELQKRILAVVYYRTEQGRAGGRDEREGWCRTGASLGLYPRGRVIGIRNIDGVDKHCWIRNDIEPSKRVDVSRTVTRLIARGLFEIKRYGERKTRRKVRLSPSGLACIEKLKANNLRVSR